MAVTILAKPRRIYLQRWDDGSLGIVVASSAPEAAALLGEFDVAAPEGLIVLDNFMACLRPRSLPLESRDRKEGVTKKWQWELEGLGDATGEELEVHVNIAAARPLADGSVRKTYSRGDDDGEAA